MKPKSLDLFFFLFFRFSFFLIFRNKYQSPKLFFYYAPLPLFPFSCLIQSIDGLLYADFTKCCVVDKAGFAQ